MDKEVRKQMAKDSVEISQYEILFKHEFAAFVDMREELKNSKTKVKKRLLEKKLAKQRGRALGAGMKLAELKALQEQMEAKQKEAER
jgi:hypothetical protein